MVYGNRVGVTYKGLRFWVGILVGFAIALLPPTLAAIPAASAAIPHHQLTQVDSTPADTLLQQGVALYKAGRFSEAVAIWQDAASTYKAQDQALDLALVLGNLSAAYQELGEWAAAEDAIMQGLAVLETLDQTLDAQQYAAALAGMLSYQGKLFWFQGQLEAAVEAWQQSALAYATAKDETGVMESLLNQAKALQVLGLSIQSESILQQVNQRLAASTNSDFKAAGLRQLGNALRRVGKLDEAHKTLEQSLALTEESTAQSSTLLALGNTARALRNRALAQGNESDVEDFTQAALRHYEQAARVNDAKRQTRAQLNWLSLLIEMGETTAAVELLPNIQTQIQMLPLGRTAIYARLNLAQSLLCANPEAVTVAASCQRFRRVRPDIQSLSEPASSAVTPSLESIGNLLATALQQAKQLSDRRAESYTLGQLGELYELTQQWPEAQSLTEQALTATETIQAPEIRYRWEWQLGRLLEKKGDKGGAIAAYNRAIEELKAARNDLLLVDPEVQFSFRDNVEPVYRRLISLLVSSIQNQPPSQLNLSQAIQTIDDLQLAEIENFLGCNLGRAGATCR